VARTAPSRASRSSAYTGKGLASLLDHGRTGRIPTGSNVALLHTGDTGNLFEILEVVGAIAG
jgi:L-cysteate sulfo-lyase